MDDYSLIRATVRGLLDELDLEVCGEAENGKEAIEKVKHLRPELVILDLQMPVMNGIEAALQIKEISPSTKIIFFTVHDFPGAARQTMLLGADAFVTKSASAGELANAVKRVLGN